MNAKEIKEEQKKIDRYKNRIEILDVLISSAVGKHRAELVRDQSILKHKIRASKERICKSDVSVTRIYSLASDGYFKR